MSPSPPAVVGPVSECSTQVRVMGQFAGSRVRIYADADPTPIADSVVDWADTFIPVDQSRLAPDQVLRATQQPPGQPESPPSHQGEPVEKAYNAKVAFATPYRCAQALHVRGCCPGAELEVRQAGHTLGQARAGTDEVTIVLAPGEAVTGGSQVEVVQRVRTSSTPVSTFSTNPDKPDPPPRGDDGLPRPRFVEPLEECVGLVTVADIVPGAVLRLRRDGAVVFDAPVGHPIMDIRIEALERGQHFEVEQVFPLCDGLSSPPVAADVVKLTALPPPRIDGPLCATGQKLTIGRLKPGATVILLAGGAEIGRWQAGADSMPVDIALPAGKTLTARQELCGKVSNPSRGRRMTAGGRWFVVEDDTGKDLKAVSFAIHTALVHTGHIVMFSGDKHNPDPAPTDENQCELFDCASLTLRTIDAPTSDVFCSGHAMLEDGRLLVAGGTQTFDTQSPPLHHEHFSGLDHTWTFDPEPKPGKPHWVMRQHMHGGRWYPTLLTLYDGSVLALSGHPEVSDPIRHQNNTMELWFGDGWERLGETDDIDIRTGPVAPGEPAVTGYLYPRIFSGPARDVFSATPVAFEPGETGQIPRASASWSITGGLDWKRNARPPSGAPPGDPWGWYAGYNTPAALLPLRQEADFRFQVLLAGEWGDASSWITDLGTPDTPILRPQWQRLGRRGPGVRPRARLNGHLVLLPSGQVLLCGGEAEYGKDAQAVGEPELLTRKNGDWEWEEGPCAAASVPRCYHSTALLMPDGRVFTGGGNRNGERGGVETRHLQLEIYEPWYVCRPRPRLLNVPARIRYGQTLKVDVRGPGPIARLVLIRCGSTTHSFNSDQRSIELIADQVDPGRYAATVPASIVAVPGHYLLFARTEELVPSKGVFIHIGR